MDHILLSKAAGYIKSYLPGVEIYHLPVYYSKVRSTLYQVKTYTSVVRERLLTNMFFNETEQSTLNFFT